MTRFFITLADSVKFVFDNLKDNSGGEISIPKMNSILIQDLIKIISAKIKIKIVGIRPGEKIHEIDTPCFHHGLHNARTYRWL